MPACRRAFYDLGVASAFDLQGDPDVGRVYDELTDGLRRPLRVSELVYAAAERYPGRLPTRSAIAEERRQLQKDKTGLEVEQGRFVSRVLADRRAGMHLLYAMSQPRPEALARQDELARTGRVDLGPVLVERDGPVGHVTLHNDRYLNAEDDEATAALEAAVDLVLLDEAVDVGVLRGGAAVHPKYAGRRVFGSGINLTHLYEGKISLVEFMIERELGFLSKVYRGHALGVGDDGEPSGWREKPWLAAVETHAIGGGFQCLLVMDRVIAEPEASFSLPARKEGIIPGCAALRLPRYVGERLSRDLIFFNRAMTAGSAEGRLIADEVVPADDIGRAVERAAAELISSGTTSVVANRRALRVAEEPLDRFRLYMSSYAVEQAHCLYSPALIANLERYWGPARRTG